MSNEWREQKLRKIRRRRRELQQIREVLSSPELRREEMSSLELWNEVVEEGTSSSVRKGTRGDELGN